MKLYAVLFTRNDFSGVTQIVATKPTLDDAIARATEEVEKIIKGNDDEYTIEEGIDNGNIEYAEGDELFEDSLLKSWYFPNTTMEVLVQEIDV